MPADPAYNEHLPRALTLEGASNVRDLGGWPVAGGGRVRFGLVFRSAALGGLTDADLVRLGALGLASVCDLRGVEERARAPSRPLPGAVVHALPIEPSIGASLRDIAATGQATGEDVAGLLRRAYVAYALDWAHRYRALFDRLLADAGPLLFHCSAGKDRTGFGAALVLLALGVEPSAMREDYLATNRLWRADSTLADGLPPEVGAALLRADAALLDGALAAAVAQCGSLDAYLDVMLGLDPPRRARLRSLLVE